MEQQETTEVNVTTLAQRLKSDVTLTAPAWVFCACRSRRARIDRRGIGLTAMRPGVTPPV